MLLHMLTRRPEPLRCPETGDKCWEPGCSVKHCREAELAKAYQRQLQRDYLNALYREASRLAADQWRKVPTHKKMALRERKPERDFVGVTTKAIYQRLIRERRDQIPPLP